MSWFFRRDSGFVQQDLSRWLGSKLASQVSTAEKHLSMAQAAEEKVSETAATAELQELKEQSLNARKDYDQARQVQTTYHENLRGVSDAIHPFSLSDSSPNDAEKVAEGLEIRAKAIEQLAGAQDISDHKDVMKKFRNQIKPLAVSVSFWWCWVSETLQGLAIDKDLEDWLPPVPI